MRQQRASHAAPKSVKSLGPRSLILDDSDMAAPCFLKDLRGQGLVEYALILALCAMVVIGALRSLGGGAQTSFGNAANAFGTAVPSCQGDCDGGGGH